MGRSTPDSSDTELGIFLRQLWRRRWVVAAGTGVAMLFGLAAFFVLPAQYEATARLAIAEFHMREALTGDDGRETFAALQSSRATYAELVNSPTIAGRVIEQGLTGSLDLSVEELLDSIQAGLIPNTAVLEITVELPDAQVALRVAQAFAEQASALSREINDADRVRAAEVLTTRLQAADAELDRLEDVIFRLRASTEDEPPPRLRRLEAEFETALAIRSDLAQRLNTSEITVAGQIGELILVDEPILPEEPSSPGALMLLVGSGFLGFVLSLLVAGIAAGIESTEGPDTVEE